MRRHAEPRQDSLDLEYRVRRGDTLWAIADGALGDPWRWPEIAAASNGITQGDGNRLTDPNLIRTAWTLRIPTAAALVPSGWRLAGVPPSEPTYPDWASGIVADGAGQIWVRSPWQLTRLDPQTGEATVWDAADDPQFASTSMQMAPADGAGVWLLDGARVRLFDGKRFPVDVVVPGEVRNLPDGPDTDGWVTGAVQVGSELWVSVLDSDVDEDADDPVPLPGSGGHVARLAQGRWSVLSEPNEGVGGDLTVDRDGAIWAGGVILPKENSESDASQGRPRRWDGAGWSSPRAAAGDAPTKAGAVVADPTGGVWFATDADGLWHLTESGAAAVARGLNRSGEPGTGKLAVSSSGDAWLVTDDALVQVSADGSTHRFESAGSVAIGAEDSVVIQQMPSVLRLDGEQFKRIWKGTSPISWPWPGGSLSAYAPSADEVWVQTSEGGWYRLRGGAWEKLDGPTDCATVASDGAMWTTDRHGLGRATLNGYRAVSDQTVDCGIFAGPDGSVWAIPDEDGDVVQFWPDGTRKSIGQPDKVDAPLSEEYGNGVCLHGVDPSGAVWVTELSDEDDEECDAGTWHRWDGWRWRVAEEPDPFTSAMESVVSGAGIGWVLRDAPRGKGTEIARYVNGVLRPVASAPGLDALSATSDGGACAFEHGDRLDNPLALVCFDAHGEAARYDAAGGLDWDSTYSVAPDGTPWLIGPQVARLPRTPPHL